MLTPRISVLLTTVFLSAAIADAQPPLRVDLKDQSQLFVVPSDKAMNVCLEGTEQVISLPWSRVQTLTPFEEGVRLSLLNEDRITVKLKDDALKFKASFGEVAIPTDQIRSIAVRARSEVISRQEVMPIPVERDSSRSENQIEYGGHLFDVWRTRWEVQDERLVAVGQIRPGFRYGHWANGRGGQVITGNRDQSWQDYEVSFDFHMEPATPDFFHASIPGETRGMDVFFRCQSMTESWNEPDTCYILGISPTGSWGMGAYEALHCPGTGWNENFSGKQDPLATGKASQPLNDGVNRFRLKVTGATYRIWLNDEMVGEFTHEEGGKIEPIPYGGFGVRWRFESLGWIQNLRVNHFRAED